jgi:SAM-dependent methyltransferase
LETIRNQVSILSVAEGFFSTSVLLALLKLDVFTLIGGGEETGDGLALRLDVGAERLQRLLRAGVVVGLLESADGDAYRLAPAARAVLVPGPEESYLGDWIRNMDMFQEALAGLDQAVATGRPTVDPAAHLGSGESATRDFTLAMHNYAALRGAELARYLDTTGVPSLLDLGCGPGTYAFHLGAVNPELELNLLDLPGVLDVAREVSGRYGLSNPIKYLPLDVTTTAIPGQYGMVLVSNTLHMLGEKASRELIRRLYDTVAPGGSLVVQAQYLADDRLGARWPVFLDLVQMCITDHGRNHTANETRTWMEEAGFRDIELNSMSLVNTNSYLRGYRPT